MICSKSKGGTRETCLRITISFYKKLLALDRLRRASDEEVPHDCFSERYRHNDFLYSRNDQYIIVDLDFFEKQPVEKFPLIDLRKFDYRKVTLSDDFKISFNQEPCDIYMKYVAPTILKGHHLKRNFYLKIMSIGFSDLIWKVFVTIMNLTNEKNKKLNFFADPIIVSINSDLRLPLDKITYFEDVVIRFDSIDKIVYRGKTHHFVDVYTCRGKIMLPA